jgi:hypothetical protein
MRASGYEIYYDRYAGITMIKIERAYGIAATVKYVDAVIGILQLIWR